LGPDGELRVHISERLIATLIREYSIDPDRRKSIRAFPDGFPKTKTGGRSLGFVLSRLFHALLLCRLFGCIRTPILLRHGMLLRAKPPQRTRHEP
jgi:hypothetical protein